MRLYAVAHPELPLAARAGVVWSGVRGLDYDNCRKTRSEWQRKGIKVYKSVETFKVCPDAGCLVWPVSSLSLLPRYTLTSLCLVCVRLRRRWASLTRRRAPRGPSSSSRCEGERVWCV